VKLFTNALLLLEIYCKICQWRNFENRSATGKVKSKI